MKKNCMSKRVVCIVVLATFMSANTVLGDNLVKKDETVYVTLDNNGDVTNEIVSDWLHSDELGVEIKDKSMLQNIENLKSDDVPEAEGETLIWKNDSGDVYYRGDAEKELPLGVSVKYYLDGNEIEAEELAGQSGEVKIKVDLTNKEKQVVTINGKEKTVYTPFTTATVVDLPLDNFKNVKVNEGEIISDGNNQVITFVSVPGLKESLDFDSLSEDYDIDLQLEESLEITADVTDFEMGPIMITATPDLSLLDDLKEAKSLDDLRDGIDELNDASQQLSDGTITLLDGEKEFNSHFVDLNSGIGKLSASSKELGDGVQQLAQSAKTLNEGQAEFYSKFGDLYTGINAFAANVGPLSDGISQLSAGVKEAQSGATQIADGTTQVVEGSATIKASTDALYAGSTSLAPGIEDLSTGLSTMDTSTGQLIAGQSQVDAGIEGSLKGVQDLIVAVGETNPLYESLKAIEAVLIATDAGADGVSAGLSQLQAAEKAAVSGADQLATGASQLEAGLGQLDAGITEFDEKVGELNAGAQAVSQGLDKIVEEGINPLAQSVPALITGTTELQDGTKQLYEASSMITDGTAKLVNEGTDPLNAAVPELVAGVTELNDGSNQLLDASNKLSEGSKELSDNMVKFNEEGIQSLSDEVSESIDTVQDFLDTKDKLFQLSEEYGTFSGLADGTEGKVKFVIKTSEISKPEIVETNTDATEEEEKGFFNWLKNIFSNDDANVDQTARR
ncbi:methyl-accepting chemotaxis protein [Clostridium sp. DL1XJH146]